MGFFSKLFGGKKEEAEPGSSQPDLKGVYSTDYFNSRYTEQDINANPEILDGCMKMVESYFSDAKVQRKVQHPINHPVNLDQVVDDGFGFKMYCQAFKLEEGQITMFLAYCFAEYLISHFGFKLYSDNQPEYPLRGMTVKYDQNGIFLSLYPFEYATKVLNYEGSFEQLMNKLAEQMKIVPAMNDILQNYLHPDQ